MAGAYGSEARPKCLSSRPATGLNAAHYVIELRKREEMQRKNEENQKMMSMQNCKNRFEEVTEQKCISNTLKGMVDSGMKAAYHDLENRRERLRKLLQEEENCYRKEKYERALDSEQNTLTEKMIRAQNRRREREDERQKAVEEKRIQQFLNNYEPIRTSFTKKNNKQYFCAQLQQLKESEERQQKELEEKSFWEEMDRKNLEKQIEEAKAKDRESKNKVRDIAMELQRQLAEKEELRLQERAMKTDELKEIEKMKEKARLDEMEEIKKSREQREAFQKLLRKQIEDHEAVLAKQNECEKLIDRQISEVANEELKHLNLRRNTKLEEARKEMIYYKEYMEELKQDRLHENKRFDELVETQRKYLEKLQDEKICQERRARHDLKKQVLTQRRMQIEEIEKNKASEKEMLVIEAQLAEKNRLENLQSQEQEAFKVARAKQKYAIELKQQMEQIRQMKEREKEEADRLMKQQIKDESVYIRKAEEFMTANLTKKMHPFRGVLAGKQRLNDCKGSSFLG